MSNKKIEEYSDVGSSSKFELEPIMKFQEMPLDIGIKKLKKAGISVSDDEASDILQLLHLLVKVTLKEFLSPKE